MVTRAALWGTMLLLGACSKGISTDDLLQPNSGGAMTVSESSRHAFSRPATNLSVAQRGEFFIGNAFFNSPWVVAPASASARDGLGPLFNARSCDGCHNNDGRGVPPLKEDEQPVSLVIQFATSTPGDNNEPQADPNYGVNFNPFAIGGVPPEGKLRIRHRQIAGTYADGTPYTLLAPEYLLEELAYGELAADTKLSPRVAPAVFGSGLLEAIPEQQILERNDPEDADKDGISGRPNYVWDPLVGRAVLGRFGWKLNQPDIAHQTAAAFSSEMGMTSSFRPQEICMPVQTECVNAPTGGQPEISDEIFDHMVSYQRMLAVPVRRNLDAPEVKRGAKLFLDSGCESCHRASFKTGNVEGQPWLSGQTIHPFTDMLLHDMGEGLADGRADFAASGSEWRTSPLWGLGLQKTVNGHTRLLHDGRARDVSEAILWHGGEGERAKEAFRNLSRQDREALLKFIDSL
ncbi:c-type cytochrome [Steroidobacter sp. S1-65]|uniref:C-type cytochrome n=1 Tax=Steroidobacter gossypii TaxID=2805490 RepID=A0ABS1WUC5_9GAMM|nr:di-heme oxidoredictase family protein [Steroidobacter gossypii]MBM0104577.1 c-type cytochrome [Steroidobacter gossypii]